MEEVHISIQNTISNVYNRVLRLVVVHQYDVELTILVCLTELNILTTGEVIEEEGVYYKHLLLLA